MSAPRTHRYGPHPDQRAELWLPAGGRVPRGVVVVVHGGFWRARYDLSLGRPLAADLVAHGWAAWNLEYRRGHGAAATTADVAAGVDALAEALAGAAGAADPLSDGGPVVGLGHSAGGHLAVWAAGARRGPDGAPGAPARVRLTAVVSQAGVLDLASAHAQDLGRGAVAALLGRAPRADDEPLDPLAEAPLPVPVRCVHGVGDDVVPVRQSEAYVARAAAGGGDATLVRVPGDHMALVDTGSPAWTRTVGVLDDLVR